jgi:hypothetical protein
MTARQPIRNAVGIGLLLAPILKFTVPQNLWDVIEATRLVREVIPYLPSANVISQWILPAAGLVVIVFANWTWISEQFERLVNRTIPLDEAALIARKRLRKTHWQRIAEGWTNNFEDSQSWFATYIAMTVPTLVKRPQSLDFEPMPREALGRGRITDGAKTMVAHGGDLMYSQLAVKTRDLQAAIKSLRKDDNPILGRDG